MRRDRGRVIAAAVTVTAAVALAGLAALVLRGPSEPAGEPGITMAPAPPDARASSSSVPETMASPRAAASGAADTLGTADSPGAAPASPVVVPPPPPQDLSPDEPDNDADDLGKEPEDRGDGDGD
ncbi:hypothetical protein [Actinomyces israelii]|uniref:hypothetical protein n=1 Tax=Actinomyces israelii TaxID=1659 RepID=UPI0012EC624A|nr:hypothetical protein [Actinomyces israelii]